MKTPIKISAIAFAGALALTACNGGGTTPGASTPESKPAASSTPSATASSNAPVKVPETDAVTTKPTTEDAAVDAAFETVERLWAVEDAQSASGSRSMKQIKELSMDPYLGEARQYFKEHAAKGGTAKGERSVRFIDGFTTPMTYKGKPLKFHSVQMEICNDTSDIVYYKKDGSKVPQPKLLKNITHATVIFDPDEKRWLVRTADFGEKAESC